jgi:hypothetical protein
MINDQGGNCAYAFFSFLKASLLEKIDFWCSLGGVWFTATKHKSL